MKTQLSIRALRIESGLTQDALAQKLGVNTASISRWEKGRNVKPLYVYALAYIFHVKADFIRT
ncbi:helix-turn-helix transcriptional regulator [Apilactobacillus timberlakei]|uniref:helix-turn-helix transcriptional regulator n=1 Tax=Apilactobacillus timberlakei TaxID=2008380 RepID=UPI001CDC12F8|nr:helix-turn-helix transcriptional regulator [Apilactobacillus timberlakei]